MILLIYFISILLFAIGFTISNFTLLLVAFILLMLAEQVNKFPKIN